MVSTLPLDGRGRRVRDQGGGNRRIPIPAVDHHRAGGVLADRDVPGELAIRVLREPQPGRAKNRRALAQADPGCGVADNRSIEA